MDQNLFIQIHHLLRRALIHFHSLIQQDYSVTISGNTSQIVADEQDGSSLLLEFVKFPVAFCLKKYVSHRQCLIHDQNFRINVDGHCKCQTHKHTAGIGFHRLVYKIPDVCKLQNAVQLCIDFLPGKSHHGTIQIHILNACIFHIKAGPQLQKSGDPSIYLKISSGGVQHTGDDLQNRGFSGAVRPDNSNGLPLFHLKAHIIQGIMLLHRDLQSECFPESVCGFVIKPVNFCHMIYLNRNVAHLTSPFLL